MQPVKKEELRKVKFREFGTSGDYIEGYFHGFGTTAHEEDNGTSYPESCAIVELENGKVMVMLPTYITFL